MKSYLILIGTIVLTLPLMAQTSLKFDYYSQQGGDVKNVPGCGGSLQAVRFCANAIKQLQAGNSTSCNADDLAKLQLSTAQIERAELTDYTIDNPTSGSCETIMVYFKLKGTGQILRSKSYLGRCGTPYID